MQYDLKSTGPQFQALSPEERKRLRDEVVEACQPVAQNWPMKTFAYRNPLRGLEHLPFDTAIREAKHLLGGNGYLSNEDYRHLSREGRITDDAVKRALQRVGPRIETQTVSVGNRPIASSDVLRLHLLFGFDALDPALLTWQLSAGGSTRLSSWPGLLPVSWESAAAGSSCGRPVRPSPSPTPARRSTYPRSAPPHR